MKKYAFSKVGVALLFSILSVMPLGGGFAASTISKSNQAPKKSIAPADSKLIAANTQFGFKLFDQLAKQDAGKNVFVSPSSVALALTMIYNGASGETQQAMAKALAVNGMSLQELNRANVALWATLAGSDPKVQLNIANSLWVRKGITFKPEFIKRNQDFYAAEISDLDFTLPSAPATINNWVNQKTNGKIDKIVETIPSDAILYLINAIYFKGAWAQQFDKSKTKTGRFTLLNGAKKQHPMMSQTGRYRYLENDEFQAIGLPYGAGSMSMYVFLPGKNSNLNAFLANLNAAKWESWMSQFGSKEGNITLPRFKLEYEVVLNNALKALGMESAFDPQRANFKEMCAASPSANVFIGEVKHKTFVEVNEEGTEAAAVTSGGMRATAYIPPFNMVVDRPFFCVIRDNQTGTVLFMGSIVEPK